MTKPDDRQLPGSPPVDDEELAAAFPGGFTLRDEANALTAYAFRNGPLEDLHAGVRSPLLDDPTLSRVTDEEMKALMINASATLARALALRESKPERYRDFVQGYGLRFCRSWQR
jgi:hypothetical protein